jgi:AcrR family transcriptional regulator
MPVRMTQTGMPTHRQSNGGDYDRARAERKAQTHADIRRAAQKLFAEQGFDAVTIADIASAASVSAQTVFNHFATKEDLFFDGHSCWVDGPADAVRSREPGVPPLAALRDHLIEAVWETVYREAAPEGRAFTETIESSPALRVHEIGLFHEMERRLSTALADAWATTPEHELRCALISATWLSAVRVVVSAHRSADGDRESSVRESRASEAAALIDQTLCRLEVA